MSGPYAAITDFNLSFLDHPTDDRMAKGLNNTYSCFLENTDELFTDNTRTDLKDNDELLRVIKRLIIQAIASQAASTVDPAIVITPLINAAPIFIEALGMSQRRANKNSFKQCMDAALALGDSHIEIKIGTSHLHIDYSQPVNLLNWAIFQPDPIAPTRPTSMAAAPASSGVPAAAAGMTEAQFISALGTALGNALATSGAAAPTSAPAPAATSTGAAPAPAPASTTVGVSKYLFNTRLLPPDVLIRYENKQKKGLILGSTITTPYLGGNFYSMIGTDKLILADGTLFCIEEPNEKAFIKASVNCEDDSHAGIRAWYPNFSQCCHDYGFYAHPIWCFKRDHGGDRGFDVGDDPDDDLPRLMEIPISKMSSVIFRILCRRDMFPRGSHLARIVRSCDGDGYRALKQVLFHSHPAFNDQPSTMIQQYPKQRDSSLLEFWKLFIDFEQLRAYVQNINATLDDEQELDIFINNTRYRDFLNRVTRDERRLPSKRYKYTGPQLVETLEKFLMSPDSPALKSYDRKATSYGKSYKKTDRESSSGPNKTFSKFRSPLATINRINAVSDDDDHESDNEFTTVADVFAIEDQVPDDDEAQELWHVYCAAVHRINRQPEYADAPDCIVCGDKHTFKNCDALNDHEWLKGVHIRLCQYLNRENAATAKAGKTRPKSFGTPPRSAKSSPKSSPDHVTVNYIDSADTSGSDTDYDEETDFQRGRS